ncbi:MAG: PucR family transcriptional regulator [Candidatus Weimeria sp.]
MIVTVKRLIEQVRHLDITLLAGEAGMDQQVSWCQLVESIPAASFLNGNEIVLCTGIGIKSDDEMLDYIKALKKNKAAAVLLNIGPYIESVPQNVIDYCNSIDMPLFEVPWKIHLAEMLRIFTYTINKEDRNQVEIAATFENAISFHNQEELYMVSLKTHGYDPAWRYTVILLDLQEGHSVSDSESDKIIRIFTQALDRKWKNYCMFLFNGHFTIVVGNYNREELHDFVDDVKRYLKLIPDSQNAVIGVGKITRSIRCLYKSYNQAVAVQKLQVKGKVPADDIYYEGMGVYKILMNVSDDEILDDYIEATIQPLIEYDRKNDMDTVKILRTYLEHNGSIQETADILFVHRNTINYRLNKIRELTGMDLSNFNCRLQLQTALMILDVRE